MTLVTPELTEWRRERVREMSRAGLSIQQMATELRITRRSVERHRDRLGLTTPNPPPLSPEEIVRAGQLLADGCSRAEVARTLGRSSCAVRRHFPDLKWDRAQMAEHTSMVQRFRRMKVSV